MLGLAWQARQAACLAANVGKRLGASGRPGRKGAAMQDRDLSADDMADIQHDLDQLVRLGLVNVDANGGLVLTEAGTDAINKITAQTWN